MIWFCIAWQLRMNCQVSDTKVKPDPKKLGCFCSIRARYCYSGYCYLESSFINDILVGYSASALVLWIQFTIWCTNACGYRVQAWYRNRNTQLGRRKWLFKLALAVLLLSVTACQTLLWKFPSGTSSGVRKGEFDPKLIYCIDLCCNYTSTYAILKACKSQYRKWSKLES